MKTAEYALIPIVPAALERRAADRRKGARGALVQQKPAQALAAFPSSALPGEDELWEVEHAARFLKRSASWVYKKTALGILPVHRLAGWGLRYVPREIRAWASEANRKHR